MTSVWTALARLTSYPDDTTVADARAALPDLAACAPAAAAAISTFLDATSELPLGGLQEQYSADFDFDPACALNVGWHLLGESHERGVFLAMLRGDLVRAGIAQSPELPDHLSYMLALVERDEPARAAELAAVVLPAVAKIEQALIGRHSPYAPVLSGIRAELSALAEHPVATR